MSDAAIADAGEKTNSTVKIEDAGPCRKKLHIEVPAETVDSLMGESVDTITVEAEIPGFRKGRAPRRLVEKKFGTLIEGEAKKQIVAKAFQEVVDEHDLKIIGQPIDGTVDDAELKAGSPLAFEVEVEVQPEFDLPELEGLEVLKPEVVVEDKDIDKQIEQMCINEGALEERESPEAGDYLTGRGIMTDSDGEEFYNIDGCVVRVPLKEDEGRGMILGVMMDDFEKQLGAPKPGDKVTLKAKGPENHEREALRGKDLTIEFEVYRCDRIVPADTEEIVARTGLGGEAQLRDAIKAQLESQAQQKQADLMRRQVAKHLVESIDMEVPGRLAEFQAQRVIERRRLELMYRGIEEQAVERHIAELRAASSEIAQSELKLFFIVHKAAEQLDVNVTEGEINGRIAQMAMQRGERPDSLRQRLIETNQVQGVFTQLREHKTLDAIVAKAKIEEVSLDEFRKKLGSQAAEDDAVDPTA